MSLPEGASGPIERLIEVANGAGKDAKNAREHLDGMGIVWKRTAAPRKPLPAPVPCERPAVKHDVETVHTPAPQSNGPLLALQWLFVLVCGLLVMRFAAWSIVTISHLWDKMAP
jgi:hypothetical protein